LRLRSSALAALALLACGAPEEPPLRIGAGPAAASEPLFLARELGALPAARVHVVELYSAGSALDALRAGSIDAAVLPLESFLRLAQQGPAPRALAALALEGDSAQLLVVRHDRLAAGRAALEDVLRGWLKALEAIRASPERSLPRMARRLRMPVADLRAALARVRHPTGAELLALSRPSIELEHLAQAAQQRLLSSEKLRSPLSLAPLFDFTALEEVLAP
jgi:ABC-type nitrate/sulfonate/bicarbonate transport system substrate-binding protein